MTFALTAYSKALYEAAAGKSKAQVKDLVDNFLTVLKEKNALSKVQDVITEIEKLDDTAEGVIRARVTSAHRLEETTLNKFEKMIRQRTGAKAVVWEKAVDKDVLGGVILQYGDTIMDMSLANTVTELAKEISR